VAVAVGAAPRTGARHGRTGVGPPRRRDNGGMEQPRRTDVDAGAVAGHADAAFDAEEAILEALLEEYDAEPARRTAIAADIDRRFRRPLAVLVLDSSGFTRTVKTMGIVHFLALLQRLDSVVQPILDANGGNIVAREGDTIFVVFPDAPAAVSAAIAIQVSVSEDNADRPTSDQVNCCIGIGYGDILSVGKHHIAGDEVNIAFKLGEDIAEGGEILVSAAAGAALGTADVVLEPVEFRVSGLVIDAYRIR
jgi:adenylate cyclase